MKKKQATEDTSSKKENSDFAADAHQPSNSANKKKKLGLALSRG